jgi:hypothetical protein
VGGARTIGAVLGVIAGVLVLIEVDRIARVLVVEPARQSAE